MTLYKSTAVYRKTKVPTSVRRDVARKYGARPGLGGSAPCHHCGTPGRIHWPLNSKASAWVTFDHEMDHLIPEYLGGPHTAANIVLACRPCNRRKGVGA